VLFAGMDGVTAFFLSCCCAYFILFLTWFK